MMGEGAEQSGGQKAGRKTIVFDSQGRASAKGGLVCGKGCPSGKWKGATAEGLSDEVEEGRPVGQRYAIGSSWLHKFELKKICGPTSKVSV